MIKYHYVIKGEPMATTQSYDHSVWSTQKANRIGIELQLRNHHENKPLLSGPLNVSLEFYFPISENPKTKKFRPNSPHSTFPSIAHLINFVETIGKGIMFKNNYCIAELSCKKLYDIHPRTEIIIYEAK